MKLSVSDVEVKGKKVLLRVDFNVPLSGGQVVDDTRIRAVLPTITDLLERGARLILVSHLGRPRGEVQPELRLDPVADRLSELLGQPVPKLDQVVGPEVQEAVNNLANGEALMLENVRFEKGEEENDPDFARQLAQTADLFCKRCFWDGSPGTCFHRWSSRLYSRRGRPADDQRDRDSITLPRTACPSPGGYFRGGQGFG